ncbi:MAG: hypothetical protein ACRETX_16660, partial [Steroidobacteraceae bacterium]
RVLLGMLRNVEHNDAAKSGTPSWFEFVAYNGHLPRRSRPLLDRRVQALGMKFLQTIDLTMKQHEMRGRKREPRVGVGVGVYLYETPTDALSGDARTRRRPR